MTATSTVSTDSGLRVQGSCASSHLGARRCARTAASICTCSTGVDGRMPCPRLKMCPGRPPTRFRMSSACWNIRGHRPEQQRRIEVALDRPVVTDALPGLVDRNAPVGADDVAAGLAQLAEDRRRAGAEVNRRDTAADAPRKSVACGAGRTRDSPRRSTCRPTSRTPARRRRPLRFARSDSRPPPSPAVSHRRCHASGWPYISALVLAKLFEWPPSMA